MLILCTFYGPQRDSAREREQKCEKDQNIVPDIIVEIYQLCVFFPFVAIVNCELLT